MSWCQDASWKLPLSNETGALLAVDIGGTFTDLLLLDLDRERSHAGKVLTTADPAIGVLRGTRALLAQAGVAPETVARVIHGTTLVTNALIERRGARTALLTTAGFRDALEIGTEGRYDIYDLGLVKPEPLVERRLRLEVPERMNAAGAVLRPLEVAALERICAVLREQAIEAVAVCYLHSYANPAHEAATAEVLRERLPDLPVTLSHRVAPALREYQRTSTAVANAYVQPLAAGYLRRLQEGLGAAGIGAPLHVMLSNGGTATVDTAADFPIRLVESGPAGGALAGAFWGRRTGHDDVLAFDMGGTTAKAVFASHGELAVTVESEVARGAPLQARQRAAAAGARRADDRDRCRRRQHRPPGAARAPDRRPRQRGLRSGTGLLRPRRPRADSDRRRPAAGLPRSAELRGR